MNPTFRYTFSCLCLAALLATGGCASQTSPEANSLRSRFNATLLILEKGDYNGAQLEFQKLTYTSRTTEYEDDVQFYLAESYYKDRQFLLALDAYQTLVRNIPSTPYVKAAVFQQGMCYLNLSPNYALDQENTKYAIQQFQAFIDTYPPPDTSAIETSIREMTVNISADSLRSLAPLLQTYRSNYGLIDTLRMAEEKIKTGREKLARKNFEAARQYVLLESYRSATLYFDEVIQNYSDSEFYERALLGKIDVLMIRQRWTEASEAIEKYESRYPDRKAKVEAARRTVGNRTSVSTSNLK